MRNPRNRMSFAPVADADADADASADALPVSGSGARCITCRLARASCLCALVPRIETRTRVVLMLHRLEDRKTSNSGRLALRCLVNGVVLYRGDREGAPALPPAPSGDMLLLFPHPDARPLESWRDTGRPLTLVVPDGTWRQAQRARRRVPGLEALPCATLSPTHASTYRLRSTPHAGRLSTLEAIAEALEVLEGPGPREALLQIFQVMVERTLRARGQLTTAAGTDRAGAASPEPRRSD